MGRRRRGPGSRSSPGVVLRRRTDGGDGRTPSPNECARRSMAWLCDLLGVRRNRRIGRTCGSRVATPHMGQAARASARARPKRVVPSCLCCRRHGTSSDVAAVVAPQLANRRHHGHFPSPSRPMERMANAVLGGSLRGTDPSMQGRFAAFRIGLSRRSDPVSSPATSFTSSRRSRKGHQSNVHRCGRRRRSTLTMPFLDAIAENRRGCFRSLTHPSPRWSSPTHKLVAENRS
jgi:hypothetical protein